MNKKTIAGVFAALFLLLSLLPAAGMLLSGQSVSAANETLSQPPKLLNPAGKVNLSVLKDTTDYIADHFFLRNELVNAWAALNAAVFKTSSEEQVLLGSDGWLYYASTLDDYMGRGMSDTELKRAASNLALIQESVESRGAKFIFTIAPNKNSLYPAQMPAFVPSAHETANVERILPYFASAGIHYRDLFSVFRERGEVLYYKTDSHWTDLGAALAADSIMDAFGKHVAYYGKEFSLSSEHRGDLYEMLFPTGKGTETAQSYADFSYSAEGNPNGGNAMRIETANEGAEGTLLCWRDSFGISLYPYLADSFGRALFLRSSSYDLTEIEALQADHVLIELVERNLDWLIRNVPVMAAPQRKVELTNAVFSDQIVHADAKTDSKHDLVYVSGELVFPYDGGAVYLCAGEASYEAFVTESNGKWFFHAHLAPEQSEGLDYLCVETDSALMCYSLQMK